MRKRLTALQDRIAASKANGIRREIPEDFKYNKKKLKHLQRVLHNVNVSLGTLVSALAEISRVKGRDISPDGLLGGLGYILPLHEVKQTLITSVHSLGDVADCLADELTNPRWNAEDDPETKKIVKEKENVEEQVEEQIEDITPEDVVTSREVEDLEEDLPESCRLNKTAQDVFAGAVRDVLLTRGPVELGQ